MKMYSGSLIVINSTIPKSLLVNVNTSVLIRSKKMQQNAGIYLLQNHSLRVSGANRTHHQEDMKL